MRRPSLRLLAAAPALLVVLVAAVALAATPARAAEAAADDFRANCATCHTIGGGRLVGPDLKDVTKRRDRDWLRRFIPNPQAVIQGGDPYAQKLLSEARGVVMPNVPGMDDARAVRLLDLIEAESALAKSQFAKVGLSDRPFTAADEAIGRDIVLGRRRLQGGGTACLSCHAVGGAGLLGGGRLAPDLTDVVARLGGRQALGAWLMAPPTATMRTVFAAKRLDPEGEILPLLAYMQGVADRHEVPPGTPSRIVFLLLGVGLAAACLVAMDGVWKRRFRGVRSPMVRAAALGARRPSDTKEESVR